MSNSILRVDISSLTPETLVERYQKNGTSVVITGLLENQGDISKLRLRAVA